MSEMQHLRSPTATGVHRAAEKISAILPPTPLLPLMIGQTECRAKAENLQPIGAFKIRGAWHRLTDLTEAERKRGVLGVSSGNHAQGVAWAASQLGIHATIVMPVDAPAIKLERTRALGADVILYDRPGGESRDEVAGRIVARTGAVLVHAYADPWVIEGQGSAGIEIAAQLGRQPSQIITCCGGGGLAAGLSLACPDAEIVTVEPEGWDDVALSLRDGFIRNVSADAPATACDALQTLSTAPINFDILEARKVRGVSVTEEQVRDAQRFAFSKLRTVLEPGGAVALAAALSGVAEIDQDTVIMMTGGNVDPAAFAQVITER